MTEIEDKVAKLEATEKDIQAKQTQLAESTSAVEEKEKQKAALDAELTRVQTGLEEHREARRNEDSTFQTKLRTENLDAAAKKFFETYQVKPEDQKQFLEDFKKFDSSAVNQDLIYKDLETTFVAQHPQEFLQAKRVADKLAENAGEYDRIASSAGFVGVGAEPRSDNSSLDEMDIQAAQRVGMPLEVYKKLKIKNGW